MGEIINKRYVKCKTKDPSKGQLKILRSCSKKNSQLQLFLPRKIAINFKMRMKILMREKAITKMERRQWRKIS